MRSKPVRLETRRFAGNRAPLARVALALLIGAAGCASGSGKTPAQSSGGSSNGGTRGGSGGGGGTSSGSGGTSSGNGSGGTSSGTGGTPPSGSGGTGTGGVSGGGGTGGQTSPAPDGGPPAGDAKADAVTETGTPPQAGKGPAGNTCPGGAYGAPLTGNMAATLVKGGLGGELEGPVWVESQKALYFTQAGGGNANGKINKYTPADGMLTTFVSNVGVGGLAVDNDGKLLAASYDKRTITRFDPVTAMRTDVPGGGSFNGVPFNEVNDIVMRADGNIYLSDPQYDSVPPGTRPMAFYRLSPPPESKVTLILGAAGANGVALSPDGAFLYMGTTESAGGPVRRVALNADGSIDGAPVSWKEGSSDGMAMDCAGNLYISIDNQIRVLSPTDQVLGNVTGLGSGYVTNSAFGDEDHKTLYITTNGSLYKARLGVPGFPN